MSDFSVDDMNPFKEEELYKDFRIVDDEPVDFIPFYRQDPIRIAKTYRGQDDDIVYVTSTKKIGICIPGYKDP